MYDDCKVALTYDVCNVFNIADESFGITYTINENVTTNTKRLVT